MAQTIALQRGSVTISHNTSTLLFTNTSSGTATRVIVGYLSWTSDFSTVYGQCTFGILRNGASSPNFSIFAANYGGGATRNISFSPNDTSTGWHGQGASSIENIPVLYNDTAGIIGAYSLSGSSSPLMATYNKNVMLGPSDQIHCGWYDNGGGNRAAVVQYCLTLITE